MINHPRSSKWRHIAFLLLLPIFGLNLYGFQAFPGSTALVTSIGDKAIKGQVVNAQDQSPLAGATVLILGSNKGTLTDANGYFEISIPENEPPTLVISLSGFANYQVEVENSGVLKVFLGKEESDSKHEFFEIAEEISLNDDQEIKITRQDATAPLLILDGKEVKEGFKMDKLNPEDIESVNVLKGEKAVEIYGEKGRNGVVEITTKKK